MRQIAAKTVLSVTAELVVSIVFGWLTTYKIDGNAGFVSGILLFICIELVKASVAAAVMEHKIDEFMAQVPSFETLDSFAEIRLLHHKRGTGEVTDHSIKVDQHRVLQLWREIISRTANSWHALQYARGDETWGLEWGTSEGYYIQEERIKCGCTIERIFIVADAAEMAVWKPVMEAQQKIGIKVRSIEKERLLATKAVRGKVDQLHTMDVAVCDARWSYLIYFDSERNVTGACLTDDAETLEACQFLIAEARKTPAGAALAVAGAAGAAPVNAALAGTPAAAASPKT